MMVKDHLQPRDEGRDTGGHPNLNLVESSRSLGRRMRCWVAPRVVVNTDATSNQLEPAWNQSRPATPPLT